MASGLWAQAIARYRVPRALQTLKQGRAFTVVCIGDRLEVTPSTGRPRRIYESNFLKAQPLIDDPTRGKATDVSYDSSYIRAILDDLRSN